MFWLYLMFLCSAESTFLVGEIESVNCRFWTVHCSVILYFTVNVVNVKSYYNVTVGSGRSYSTVAVSSGKSSFTIHSLRVPKLRKYKSEENTASQINNNSLWNTYRNLFKIELAFLTSEETHFSTCIFLEYI